MNLRRNPEHQFSGKRFLWLFTQLFAGIQVVRYCFLKGFCQLCNTLTMECNHIFNAQKTPEKDIVAGIEFNAG